MEKIWTFNIYSGDVEPPRDTFGPVECTWTNPDAIKKIFNEIRPNEWVHCRHGNWKAKYRHRAGVTMTVIIYWLPVIRDE